MANIKLALRTLSRTPFVTAIAVLSLALGIGANAAIFSLFEQMLLRPLPVQQPDRLVNLQAPGPKPGWTSCGQAGDCEAVFSYPMLKDLQREQTPFTGIAAHISIGANLAFQNQTISGQGMLVSGSYFPVLGVRPALGRLLTPSDDENEGAHFVTVLGHRFWESRLGSDPNVIGQPIIINGQSMTIVGVAAPGFDGTTLLVRPEVYVPLSMRRLVSPGSPEFDNRSAYWAYLFARLRPGVSMEQAHNAINALYQPIIRDVEAPLQEEMSDATMARFVEREIILSEGQRGQSSAHEEGRMPLILLFSITGIVLLIACANIANLLLARAATRSMEMAVRLSLGASRWQVIRQLLVESIILALMGGVASLLVAHWTLLGIASIMPAELAQTMELRLRMPVVGFAAALSLGTGLLFGLFPALHSTRPDLITTLRANAGQPSGAKAAARFRTSLVTAQIALSMALLISAGLFTKSLANISRVELGFDPENLVTFRIAPVLSGYDSTRSRALFERVEEELAALPGVSGVTASRVPLLAGNNWGTGVSVQGFRRDPDTDNGSRYSQVGTEYFSTVGVQMLAGREFTLADNLNAPKVAVVNEAFAEKFNLGREAVGKRMSTESDDDNLDTEIVGLARNAKYSDVKDEIPPQFFTPYRQSGSIGSITFYVRSSLAPERLLRAIPGVIRGLDPNLPVEDLKTLPQQVRENVFLDRMISILSASSALLATLLAAIGLYGVLAYTVAQRTREFGVRMALGADGRRVRGMVLRQVGLMTLIGGVIGIVAALGLGRAAQSLLYGLEGNDPLVIAGAVVLLSLVAFGAGFIPALRASRVEPMQALRYE